MNVEQLHDLFLQAAETDRRLPPATRKQKLSSWPDYPLDWHGYGWTQQGPTRLHPTSKQISDFDEAMRLTSIMPEDDRRLVWAVAHSAAFRARGPAWKKLAIMLGLHDPRIVKRNYRHALIELHYKLHSPSRPNVLA